MRTARARRTVEFLAQTPGTRDVLNHVTPGVWAPVATTRGSITYKFKPSERRDSRASTVVSTVTAWITVRYRPGITGVMRVRTAGQLWNIVDVQPDEKQRWMRVLCEKVQAAANG